ncbi:MAG: methane monooxygenase, partial [Methylococcales bacterium]|nr:methane monooxygenase [Methylococcales bacterium]
MSTSANAYNAGIMAKTGKDFADEYFAEKNQVVHESDTVVLVLKKSDELNTVVEEILLG